jgi:tripartite-type tricarboxylate transporter receptor subunit TctC
MRWIRWVLEPLVPAAIMMSAVASAQAQPFPSKPITLVVPYAPGGNVDQSARILQSSIGGSLGQPIVIENKPGAAGQLAGDYVARSEPDGHTLFIGSNGPVLYASLTTSKPLYQWDKVFAPVTTVSSAATVLVVRSSLPVKTVQELMDHAKTNADRFSLATGGAASINHMISELLQLRTGIKWAQVHYRGNAPALNDLIGGHVDAGFGQLADSLGHIESGKLRAIAVLGKTRIPILPDVPTMAEAGYGDIEAENFVAILAPIQTPKDVVEKLSVSVRDALGRKETQEQFARLGSTAGGSTPEELLRFLQRETATWTEVVAKAGIKADN